MCQEQALCPPWGRGVGAHSSRGPCSPCSGPHPQRLLKAPSPSACPGPRLLRRGRMATGGRAAPRSGVQPALHAAWEGPGRGPWVDTEHVRGAGRPVPPGRKCPKGARSLSWADSRFSPGASSTCSPTWPRRCTRPGCSSFWSSLRLSPQGKGHTRSGWGWERAGPSRRPALSNPWRRGTALGVREGVSDTSTPRARPGTAATSAAPAPGAQAAGEASSGTWRAGGGGVPALRLACLPGPRHKVRAGQTR